jgi:hypothetical protein
MPRTSSARLENRAEAAGGGKEPEEEAVGERLAGGGARLRREMREDFSCELAGVQTIHAAIPKSDSLR